MDLNKLRGNLKELRTHLQKIHAIAARLNLTVEELCWKYVNSFQEIDAVVVGVESVEQLIRTVNVSSMGTLDQMTIEEIGSLTVDREDLLSPSNWDVS